MFVLLRSYTNTRKTLLSSGKYNAILLNNEVFPRHQSNEKDADIPELINSTILIENGFNVTELPVVIRKLKNLTQLEASDKGTPSTADSVSYHLIQEEFKQCTDLRDVFSLITKCTKITPNIALGAIERIHDLERNPLNLPLDIKGDNTLYFAKGAILEKLLKVVIKTEDTQTILNILKTNSLVIEPYKNKFCDELLFRVTDNKLNIDQLIDLAIFLLSNIAEEHYNDMLDKLWIGFTANESSIDETNIVKIFTILPGLKTSKKTVINLVEQKLSELWPRINSNSMQEIMSMFISEKYFSMQSFAVLGNWFYAHIHALDEDTLLDIITKFTRLNYTDDHIEAAVEKYMRLKGPKVNSYILIVGILNYCMQFQLRNKKILDTCCDHYLKNMDNIPPSFLKSFIHPFGYLCFKPVTNLWEISENILIEVYRKIGVDDLCSIMLSYIYVGEYPVKLAAKVFNPEYYTKINNTSLLQKLYLIDTVLSIECKDYLGPLMPKDQWPKPVKQNQRVYNLVEKIKDMIGEIFGKDRVSTGVLVPNYCSDENFVIDIMLHPFGLGSDTFNWKLKSTKNENIALLIHLPDHYCSKSEQLIGPQIMKKRHLEILGFKVVSLKYSVVSHLYMSYKNKELKKYLIESVEEISSH
ncbi:unnamed protein product [Leptosia nina]|uniref:RAP domain-containing protein n=1 Tax=Leptosia nina TaxID=320188 RepID=A0AAV1ISZ9_9NEOP